MDEPSKHCVQEIRPQQGMRPGQVARYDAEYERNGVGHLLIYYTPLMIGAGPMWQRITQR